MTEDKPRAQLAQPEPEGLTDEELLELMPEGFRGDLAIVSRMAAHGAGPDVGPGLFRVSLNTGALDYARAVEAAVLARWGHPTPQPPADGEVAELVEWLRESAHYFSINIGSTAPPRLTRAAELLQHLSPPQPEPVSKRLPGAKDCDNRGRCWTTDHDPSLVYSPVWKMTELPRQDLGHDFSSAYFWRNVRFWLPAHAIPIPTSEEASSGG